MKIFPVVKKVVEEVAASELDISWDDSMGLQGQPAVVLEKYDTVAGSDATSQTDLDLPESSSITETSFDVSGSGDFAEDVGWDTFNPYVLGASLDLGTMFESAGFNPDVFRCWWIDRANPDTSHEGANPLAKTNTPVVNDERRGYIALDLRGISELGLNFLNGVWTGSPRQSWPISTFGVDARHSTVGGADLTANIGHVSNANIPALNPTWNSMGGSITFSGSRSETLNIPYDALQPNRFYAWELVGDISDFTWAMSGVAGYTDRWLVLEFLGDTGVGGDLSEFELSSVVNNFIWTFHGRKI